MEFHPTSSVQYSNSDIVKAIDFLKGLSLPTGWSFIDLWVEWVSTGELAGFYAASITQTADFVTNDLNNVDNWINSNVAPNIPASIQMVVRHRWSPT
jgi:hypothetical protein